MGFHLCPNFRPCHPPYVPPVFPPYDPHARPFYPIGPLFFAHPTYPRFWPIAPILFAYSRPVSNHATHPFHRMIFIFAPIFDPVTTHMFPRFFHRSTHIHQLFFNPPVPCRRLHSPPFSDTRLPVGLCLIPHQVPARTFPSAHLPDIRKTPHFIPTIFPKNAGPRAQYPFPKMSALFPPHPAAQQMSRHPSCPIGPHRAARPYSHFHVRPTSLFIPHHVSQKTLAQISSGARAGVFILTRFSRRTTPAPGRYPSSPGRPIPRFFPAAFPHPEAPFAIPFPFFPSFLPAPSPRPFLPEPPTPPKNAGGPET